MAHTNYTPQLTASACFTFDGNGNLKMLEGTAATLQNVSNECRCFTDDLYFYAEHGIDWFSDQLGKPVQKAVTAARLRDSRARTLTGRITIRTTEGDHGRSEI